jgi:putative tricarboxylic transport membrane protein
MQDDSERTGRSRFELVVPMKPGVLAATALVLAWLAFMAYETTRMLPPILPGYPGDSFFPRLVIVFAAICALVILIKGALSPRGAPLAPGEEPSFTLHWPDFAIVCVLVVAYGVLLEPVGFEVTTLVLMMAFLVPRIAVAGHGRVRSVLYALALALPTTLIFYVGFGLLLRVPLPLLFLPRYIQF